MKKILLVLLLLFCLCSCNNSNSEDDGTHYFYSSYDENGSFLQCDCGKQKEFVAHEMKDYVCTKCEYVDYEKILRFELNETGDGFIVADCKYSVPGKTAIPNMYKGLPVVEIDGSFLPDRSGDAMFKSIESIVIPSNVKKISEYTFRGNSNLKTVIFGPNSKLETIEKFAFEGCSNLENIQMPSSIRTIHYGAFVGCEKLECNLYKNGKYLGNKDNPYLILLDVVNKEVNTLEINENTQVISGFMMNSLFDFVKFDKLVIPRSVKGMSSVIADNLYYQGTLKEWCDINNLSPLKLSPLNLYILDKDGNISYEGNNYSLLTDVIIPDGVTEIRDFAFASCSSITSITIPDGVTRTGDKAFYNCVNLKKISIPNSVKIIGEEAFGCCENLTYNIYQNVKYLGDEQNPYHTLVGVVDTDVEDILINEKTKVLYGGAFNECKNINSLNVPDSVISLGNIPYSINTIRLPKTIERVCDLFASNIYYDGNIGEWIDIDIDIDKKDTEVNPGGFEFSNLFLYDVNGDIKYNNKNYSLLTKLEIPEGTTIIKSASFRGCQNINKVVIPKTVEIIGDFAFQHSSVNEVIIPLDGAVHIGYSAFTGCQIGSIVIPESVRSVGTNAFGFLSNKLIIFNNSNEEISTFPTFMITIYNKGEWSYVNGVPTPNKN